MPFSVLSALPPEQMHSVVEWPLGPFALAHYRVYGDAPHAPRGCFAQAWNVGEVQRAWLLLEQQKRQAVREDPRHGD